MDDVVEDVDLIFNDQREYKNGSTPVVRTVFEKLNDISIHVTTFLPAITCEHF